MDFFPVPEQDRNVILYVDDEEANLVLFKEYMKTEYEVLITTSTSQAYQMLKENPVKILISDQRMPEESGLDFIERISPEFPLVIKIIFTAYYDHDSTLQAINQGGIYRFMMKPWNYQEIKNILESALREFNLRYENINLVKQLQTKNTILENTYHKIRQSERKFTGIFQASSDGMILFKDNNIIEVNQAFLQLVGFNTNSFNRYKLSYYLQERIPLVFTPTLGQSKEHKDGLTEIEFMTDKNEKRYLELKSRDFDLSGEVVVLSVIRDITERKMIDQKIVEAIFRTQEDDQARYARELHDGLGPVLSTLKMYVEWLSKNKSSNDADLVNRKAIQTIDDAICQVREISNNISPHVLQNFGLVNALKTYIDGYKETHQVKFHVHSDFQERLSPNLEIMLYRILLECLNNSMKHASASSITIYFKKIKNILKVLYTDNGKGFDPESAIVRAKGMGLFNMQNRIKLIGGKIDISSAEDKGTQIEITLTL